MNIFWSMRPMSSTPFADFPTEHHACVTSKTCNRWAANSMHFLCWFSVRQHNVLMIIKIDTTWLFLSYIFGVKFQTSLNMFFLRGTSIVYRYYTSRCIDIPGCTKLGGPFRSIGRQECCSFRFIIVHSLDIKTNVLKIQHKSIIKLNINFSIVAVEA